MIRADLAPAIWQVAFFRDEPLYWFDRFLHRGFMHVMCFGYSTPAKAWIVYDPALDGVDLRAIPHGEAMAKFYQDLIENRATIIRVRTGDGVAPWRHRFFFTCVTGVKQIVRSRSGALRPLALLRDLIAEGGEIVFWRGEPYESKTSERGPAPESATRPRGTGGGTANHLGNATPA